MATKKKKASKRKGKPSKKKTAKKGAARSAKKAPRKKRKKASGRAPVKSVKAPGRGIATAAPAPAAGAQKTAKAKGRRGQKKATAQAVDENAAPAKKVSRKRTKVAPASAAPAEAGESSERAAEMSAGDDNEPPSPGIRIEAGARAPSFHLVDQDGVAVSSDALSGNPYVIYFYPRDDTPGCTREACGFRDDLARFEQAGVRVLGVSPDTPESHAKFRNKYGLTFTLLSDRDKALAQKYGVWGKKKLYGKETMGIQRSTFLVGKDGLVRRVWRHVKVDGHAGAVLDALGGLS